MNFKEFLEIPSKLYHATFKTYLPSIQKHGLTGKTENKNYSDSKNVVYLATTKEVAESYADTTEEVPEEWLDQIVILEIYTKDLDILKLTNDRNVRNEDKSTFEYDGTIPWKVINIV